MTMLWAEMNVPSGAAAIVGITNVSSVTAYGSAGKVGTSIGTPLVDGAHSLQYDLIESCDAVACQGVTTKRVYNSSRRAAQAAQTRADVLAAAVECFSESGWSGTTLNAIAERAGVAVETVYNGFGNKKQLLREAMDVAVVGDAEPIPLVDRPEWAERQRGSRAERVAKGGAPNGEPPERTERAESVDINVAHTNRRRHRRVPRRGRWPSCARPQARARAHRAQAGRRSRLGRAVRALRARGLSRAHRRTRPHSRAVRSSPRRDRAQAGGLTDARLGRAVTNTSATQTIAGIQSA